MLACSTSGVGLIRTLHGSSPTGTVGVIRKGSTRVPSIFVRRGPDTSARRPVGRRYRPWGQPDRTTLEWAIRNPDLRLRGTPGTRQPGILEIRCTGPRRHDPSQQGDHSYPQYPQDKSGRRALLELREVPAGRFHRDRADRANICLNRRDVAFESARRTVIHRLLRCPAHTEGGVVVRSPFSAFRDFSTENSTYVDNLNGA